MIILLHIVQIAFVLFGLSWAFGFAVVKSGRLRSGLVAFIFFVAAIASFQLSVWWPLIIGFAAIGIIMFTLDILESRSYDEKGDSVGE